LENLDNEIQGVAIFACSGAGLFKVYEFQVPFDENLFFVFDRPHLYPLIKLVSQNRRFAVAQADTNSAHIYVFGRGEVFSREDIQNEKTNRSEVGGWSQMRYQRHIDNFHQQHAKEVVAELEKLIREDRVDRVVLAGDEAVIIPILKGEITKELEDKVIGTVSLSVNAPEHEVLEAAEKIVNQHNTLEDMKVVETLKEQDYENGLGVSSIGKVLPALLNGQVQELYISSNFDSIDYNIGQVNKIFKDYAPGIDEDLPSAKQTGLVIDEILRIAVQTADDIRFIQDDNLLKEVGGVGALLRYQAKGVNV
jgi:peptide chain release factor subunit 1